jgi:2-oxoglutarate ferredoxin oxidoreductase subunit alpha
MPSTTQTICLAGEAGQGLDTMGQLLAKGLVRSGYHIHVTQSSMSRIRGGHNYFLIRTGPEAIHSPGETIDLLVALNQESVSLHSQELAESGLVLVNEEHSQDLSVSHLAIPFAELAEKPVLQNVAALGCLAALLGLKQETLAGLVEETLGKRHKELLEENLEALGQGFAWTSRQQTGFSQLPKAQGHASRLTLSGNQAISLGAMAGGANFCSFYPMTPSTGVALNLVAQMERLGIVAEQAEDEIAAVNMAIGASFCGARSLVPTSGGGFALMSEGISLAGMTETPLVIVLAQRPGPATGLPTRTEQGDLNLALYSGHGEFPRAVLAPGTPEECFHLTFLALNLAERSQSPVIVLTDQYLADSYRAVEPFDLEALPELDRPLQEAESPSSYERFAWNESGVSPRALPGLGEQLVVADSDEHTPDGHITEDHAVRTRMVDKRRRKEQVLLDAVQAPSLDGPDKPDLLLLSWGSTKGPLLEAAQRLRQDGHSVATLHFSQVWPLNPDHFMEPLQQAGRVVSIEGNARGQLADLIRQRSGFHITERIGRYDGLPLTAGYILERVAGGNA